MILDDIDRMKRMDPQGMLGHIQALPDQLERGWEQASGLPLHSSQGIRQVIFTGMGGSAIAGDLVAAYAAPLSQVPLFVWRNYGLPAYARGPETLVVATSHSGETEETLSSFEAGLQRGTRLLAVATGGELRRRAEEAEVPLWAFEHDGQPRAAVGITFSLLLAAMYRLGILPDPAADLAGTVEVLRDKGRGLQANIPVVENPAKRMAGQLMGRWPMILGSDFMEPVARRWRTQIAELAKALAQYEGLPEADHNMVAGVEQPEPLFSATMVVFLRSPLVDPRNLTRLEETRKLLMLEGFNTDIIEAQGDSRLAHQWSALQFGDYTAYYLAMAYGVDPTPVQAITELKERLSET